MQRDNVLVRLIHISIIKKLLREPITFLLLRLKVIFCITNCITKNVVAARINVTRITVCRASYGAGGTNGRANSGERGGEAISIQGRGGVLRRMRRAQETRIFEHRQSLKRRRSVC